MHLTSSDSARDVVLFRLHSNTKLSFVKPCIVSLSLTSKFPSLRSSPLSHCIRVLEPCKVFYFLIFPNARDLKVSGDYCLRHTSVRPTCSQGGKFQVDVDIEEG